MLPDKMTKIREGYVLRNYILNPTKQLAVLTIWSIFRVGWAFLEYPTPHSHKLYMAPFVHNTVQPPAPRTCAGLSRATAPASQLCTSRVVKCTLTPRISITPIVSWLNMYVTLLIWVLGNQFLWLLFFSKQNVSSPFSLESLPDTAPPCLCFSLRAVLFLYQFRIQKQFFSCTKSSPCHCGQETFCCPVFWCG